MPPAADLTITIAQPTELPIVLDILREAAAWLWERGVHQWTPAEFTEEAFAPSVAQGTVALAWRGDVPVGTVTLNWADPDVWGPDGGQAGYVHKLAARRAAAGQGVSHSLLDWAAQQCAQAGKPFLRLDCWAGNATLREFYTNAGFTLRDIKQEITPEETWECALFEKHVQGK